MFSKLLFLLFLAVGCCSCDNSGGHQNTHDQNTHVTTLPSPDHTVEPKPTRESASTSAQQLDCEGLARALYISSIEGAERGAEEYEKVINSGCDTAYARYQFGRALRESRQYKRAAEQLRIATVKNPKDWALHFVLAQTLILDLNEFDEGLKELEIARKLDKDGLTYIYDYYFGRAYEGQARYKEALAHFQRFEKKKLKVFKNDEQLLDAQKRIRNIKELIKGNVR